MRKVMEALFRHKWLVFVPPILIPLLVAPIAIYTTPVAYESIVSVWVDRPAYIDLKGGAPQFASAAQSQSSQLSELLRTRAFVVDVARRTSLAPVLATKGGDARVADLLDRGVAVAAVPSGSHLITIRARFSTPQLAFQVAQAVVDAYRDRNSDQQLDQSGLAISFFQSQLQSAQDDLTKASQSASQYAIAMGYASSGDGTPLSPETASASAFDSVYAELQGNVRFAQQQADTARAGLQSAQLSSAAAVQGNDMGFQVLDPPQVPTAPAPAPKTVVTFVAAALVLGLGISTMLLVVLVASDRSIRHDSDLVPPVRILGVVPKLKVKQRLPKVARAAATRRAIGFVAGTALPAPRGTR